MGTLLNDADQQLERYQRYENRLQLSIHRAMRELHVLQKKEEEEMTPWLGERLPSDPEPPEAECENEPTEATAANEEDSIERNEPTESG